MLAGATQAWRRYILIAIFTAGLVTGGVVVEVTVTGIWFPVATPPGTVAWTK